MRRTQRGISSYDGRPSASSIDLARTFGVDAAAETPLIRLPRRLTTRTGAASAGAVSCVTVLVLAVLGVVPYLLGIAVVLAFGLGLLPARVAPRSMRGQAVAVGGPQRAHFVSPSQRTSTTCAP